MKVHNIAPNRLSDSVTLWHLCQHEHVPESIYSTYITQLSTVGDHAFLVSSSQNSLLPDITSAPMLTVFRNCLKTYLFFQSFSS